MREFKEYMAQNERYNDMFFVVASRRFKKVEHRVKYIEDQIDCMFKEIMYIYYCVSI